MSEELKQETADTGVENLENTSLLDLDNLSDMNMDEIPDAPGFVDPPDGIYVLRCTKACIETYKTREEPNKDKKRFAHYYAIEKVIELDNSDEQEPSVGSKFGERFLVNADGMKYWKSKAKAILGDVGSISVADALAELSTEEYVFKARVQTRESKGKKESDKNKTYRNVQIRVLGRVVDVNAEAAAEGATQL